jgi:hypothetical protein
MTLPGAVLRIPSAKMACGEKLPVVCEESAKAAPTNLGPEPVADSLRALVTLVAILVQLAPQLGSTSDCAR